METQVGAKVRSMATGEVGIVIHSWFNEKLDSQDNYVAFFGTVYPQGEPRDIPYVLRYLSDSLEVVRQGER